MDTRPYRLGVGILLVNREGLVFVGQRVDSPDPAWQLPQGGIDEGETPSVAAMRELFEETGVTQAEIVAETSDWLSYDLPPELSNRVWRGRYRGQKQKWFVARFTGADSDIKIDGAHPEFSAWRWLEVDQLPALIVPFKRALYTALVAELGPRVKALAA